MRLLVGASACGAIGCATIGALAGGSAAPAPTVNLNIGATNASAFFGVTSNPHILWTVPLAYANHNHVNGIILDAQGVLYTPGIGPLNSQTGAALPPVDLQLSSGAAAIGPDGSIYQWEGSTLHAYHSDRTSSWTARPYGGTSANGVRVAPNGNVYARGLDSNLYVYSPSGTLLWSRPCLSQPNSIPIFDAASNVYYDMPAGGFHLAVSYDPQGNQRYSAQLIGTAQTQVRRGPDGNIYTTENDSNTNEPYTTVRDPSNGSLLRQFTSQSSGIQAIAPDGTLYTALLHTVRAQNPTGSIRWSASVASNIFVQYITADAAGNLFCTTEQNQVLAFSAAGAPLWSLQLPVTTFQSLQPIIGSDGTIYVRSGDNLCAIAGTVPVPGAPAVFLVAVGFAVRRKR